jgi:hypothetical protein
MATHRCNKEKEISDMSKDIGILTVDVAVIKEQNKHHNQLLNEVHKALCGNGKPGLIDDVNKMKGGILAFRWIVGVILTILTIVLAAIAQGLI